MKILYSQKYETPQTMEEDFTPPSLQEDMKKTRIALEIAYAGFDNAVDEDMIDCYIYEINALLKRYKHLTELAAGEQAALPQPAPSPIRALVSHVFGWQPVTEK